jgi:LCP family protein required for cell wall assembly
VLKVQSPGAESVFNKPVVVLVAAVDTRPNAPNDLGAVNTDTIMLARLDPIAKDVRVLSVPRDLQIGVSYEDGSRSPARANTSFAIGAENGRGLKAGMDHLQADLEHEFGISIDYWVQVDFRGAERLIDAVGGVDVTIPEDLAIDRWWYSDDDIHGEELSFLPGPQHLDGYNAVAFARLRALDDDLHRIKRQQLVLQAAVAKAFSTGFLSDPMGAWGAYSDAIRTDVPSARLPGYALLVRQTQGRLTNYSLADEVGGAPSVVDAVTPGGAAVLKGQPAQIQHWLEVVFGEGVAGEAGR